MTSCLCCFALSLARVWQKLKKYSNKHLVMMLDQKQHRLEISTELKEQVSNDPHFLFKVISGDESWI